MDLVVLLRDGDLVLGGDSGCGVLVPVDEEVRP